MIISLGTRRLGHPSEGSFARFPILPGEPLAVIFVHSTLNITVLNVNDAPVFTNNVDRPAEDAFQQFLLGICGHAAALSVLELVCRRNRLTSSTA